MKAITLWEPWATLVATGVKTWETRSWRFPQSLRGERIAIHAAKRWTPVQLATARFFARLGHLDFDLLCPLDRRPGSLGKILCTAVLAHCATTDACVKRWNADNAEFVLGDFGPGRFAWKLSDRRLVTPPVAAVGRQRLWTVESSFAAALSTQLCKRTAQ